MLPSPPPAALSAAEAANLAIRAFLDGLPGGTPRTGEERDVLAGLWEEWETAVRDAVLAA